MDLHALNAAAAADFAAALDGVFEHAPWVAEAAVTGRPYASVGALHDALMAAVAGAGAERVVGFLNAHPELAADRLPPGLTPHSQAEQSGLGMAGAAGAADLSALNRAYRDRFGFPFIVCVARHTPESVLRTLSSRLAGNPAEERARALAEVGHITRLRLVARVDGPGAPVTGGHLSTHALDTSLGCAAAGLALSLLAEGRTVARTTTDADGRCGGLLPPGPLRGGRYTLLFEAGAYFAARSQSTLYETIPVPFTVTEPEGRYHIPLLLAPFGYSTYRGS